MSEIGQIIFDTAERIFAAGFGKEELRRASQGEWLSREWGKLEEAGLPMALVDEASGGFGVETADALKLVGLAARFAVPLPIVETMFANHLLAQAGLDLSEGPVAVVIPRDSNSIRLECVAQDEWRLSGWATSVAWAAHVGSIILVAPVSGGNQTDYRLVRVAKDSWTVEAGRPSIAGYPLDRIELHATLTAADCAPLPENLGADVLLRGGAALRVIGIAETIQHVLEKTVDYLETRKQFGRQLARFQALQHEVAKMAGQAAAAAAASGMAAEAFAQGFALAPIAAAKARAGEAASIIAGVSHQLHGAIGVTEEYDLHHLTRQLWAWRDEFGNEAFWSHRLGELALNAEDDLWTFITAL